VKSLDDQSLSGGMHSAGKSRPRQTHKGDFGVGFFGNRIPMANHRFGDSGGASRFFYCAKISASERGEDNKHPTVKPQKLMTYLCRLVTPNGGIVLDPFMGSGSTGVAAISEGLSFIGIEKEDEYFQVAVKRCS